MSLVSPLLEYISALTGSPGTTSSVFSTYAITEPSCASEISQLSVAVAGTMLSLFVIIVVIFDL